jgi:TPR repeat protein
MDNPGMVRRASSPGVDCAASARRGWRRIIFLLAWSITTSLGFGQPASACGWWGDSEGDAEAVVIGADGRPVSLRSGGSTAQALTRQANALRQRGEAGYPDALELYRRAAEEGYPPAQNNLAGMYEMGLGVAADLTEARRWYRLAAAGGEPRAQHSLGEMLITGRGVDPDPAAGLAWIRRAAEQDHPSACADLGRMYAAGEGVPRDDAKARYWWQRAAGLGVVESAEALKRLAGE